MISGKEISALWSGGNVFNPLSLKPVFWFDYNKYPVGALAGGELDETGNYSITKVNNPIISLDGTVKSLDVTRATPNIVSYGNTFNDIFKSPHTHMMIYKPKEGAVVFDALCGNAVPHPADGYGIFRNVDKLRLFLKIGGTNNIFESVDDTFSLLQYYIIIFTVQQSGVVLTINGVNIPLANSNFTSTLSNLATTKFIYTGGRNNNSTMDLPIDGYIGDHLLFPSILTPAQKTLLTNYFV